MQDALEELVVLPSAGDLEGARREVGVREPVALEYSQGDGIDHPTILGFRAPDVGRR